jgi:hypothetical protein
MELGGCGGGGGGAREDDTDDKKDYNKSALLDNIQNNLARLASLGTQKCVFKVDGPI